MKLDDGEVNIKSNPKDRANCLSILFFWYSIEIFRKGVRNEYVKGEIYRPLQQNTSKELGNKLETEWAKQLCKKKPSLFRALSKTFRREFLHHCIILFVMQMVKISQPVSLYFLLRCLGKNREKNYKDYAYLFTTLIVLATFIIILTIHRHMLSLAHLGLKVRLACSALIYRKILKLYTEGNIVSGTVVNLLTTDLSRFDYLFLHLPYLIVIWFDLPIVLVLLCTFAGYSTLAGFLVILLVIPSTFGIAKNFTKTRLGATKKTDSRVRLMSEIINGIKVIKMFTWEKPFLEIVYFFRKLETKLVFKIYMMRAIILSFSTYLARTAVLVTVVIHVFISQVPSPEWTFLVIAFFNILRQNVTLILPNIVSLTAETKASIGRLQTFLLKPDIQKQPNYFIAPSTNCVTLENVHAKWSDGGSEETLIDLNIYLKRRDLLAVIGTVGSGKSSLLTLILGELQQSSGNVQVDGNISYCAQEPWLFAGSIRENILFAEPFDPVKYERVVEACALQRDFHLFPSGDQTLIGDRGILLSGGQRARINLARAIYKDSDVYLLDDPLAAVDAKVGSHIFHNCILDYLSDKCTVLVTHQIQFLKLVPRIVMLQNGMKIFEGTYNDLENTPNEFTSLLLKDDDESIDDLEKMEEEKPQVKMDAPDMEKEAMFLGKVSAATYSAYLKAGGKWWRILSMLTFFFLTQVCSSSADIFITIWIHHENLRATGKGGTLQNVSTRTYVYVYTALVLFTVVITVTRSLYFFKFCSKASDTLHNRMLSSVIYAPLSFFNKTPSGRIINRFSRDIGVVDDQFPNVVLDVFQIALQVLAVLIITIFISWMVSFVVIILAVLFYFLRLVYLKASRNIKRLEAVTRSPVYTHINSTLQGLAVIRAFKAEDIMLLKFDQLQDNHSSSFYLHLQVSRAFGFFLDAICALYILCVSFSLIIFEDDENSSIIGLSITQSLTLMGMFQWGMRQWSELESHLTSIERIVEYIAIQKEEDVVEPALIPDKWPERGEIEYNDVCLRYSEKEPLVLDHLSFSINSKEKIGIVGRTGAGKSSLIGTIFRLVDFSGNIFIDGIDTKLIPLEILRSRISIIPQEPVLFARSLRRNLDPYKEYSDDAIWRALECVELKNTISDLPNNLSCKIAEGGTNFSVGQRQLLCLARALLRNSNILILDEATANVDPKTDHLIQETIRCYFGNCTVLTIAHRLNTIIDYDKVLVMDAGQIKEFNHPFVLMNNKFGYLYNMAKHTGQAGSSNLLLIAKNNYDKKYRITSFSSLFEDGSLEDTDKENEKDGNG